MGAPTFKLRIHENHIFRIRWVAASLCVYILLDCVFQILHPWVFRGWGALALGFFKSWALSRLIVCILFLQHLDPALPSA